METEGESKVEMKVNTKVPRRDCVGSPVSGVSPVSPDSARDDEGEERYVDKTEEFIKSVVDKHRAAYMEFFPGDSLVELAFAQTMIEARWMCKVFFRSHGQDEEAETQRVQVANSLLKKPFLEPNNQFDIVVDAVPVSIQQQKPPNQQTNTRCEVKEEQVEPKDKAEEEEEEEEEEIEEANNNGKSDDNSSLQFAKILFNGWHVPISKETFQLLAYGDYKAKLNLKEYENIHSLGVRGDIIDSRSVGSSRTCLVLACANDDVHKQRNEERDNRKKQAEARAKYLCLGSDDSTEQDQVASELRKQVALRELHIRLDPSQHRRVQISSNTHTLVEATFTPERCLVPLQKMIAKVAEKNLARLQKSFRRRMKCSLFKEKYDYWHALRTSSGTTQRLLLKLFDTCLRGGDDFVFEGAKALAEQYRRRYKGSPKETIAQRLVQWQASASLSTGFVSGFGGFMTMAVAIPAGLLAAWTTSARLAFAIAHIYGHDIYSPSVCAAVLYALAGSARKPDQDSEGMSTEEELQLRLRSCALMRRGEHIVETTSLVTVEQPLGSSEEEETIPATELEVSVSSKEFAEKYETLYDLLQVPRDATPELIRSSFRKLALRCHPDKMQQASPEQLDRAKERFQVIVAAYEVLSNEDERRKYDAELAKGSWSWSSFGWNKGIGKAKAAFQKYCDKDHHGVSKHVATRAVTQVTVNVVEEIASKSAVKSFAAAELRTSIVAGEKLAAQATSQSASKMIPFVGALISGAIDCATTASVGRSANRVFNCLE